MGALGRLVAVVVFAGLCGTVVEGSVAAQEVSAPRRVGVLADQSVRAGEVVEVDVSGGFSGSVASYAVVSSDSGVVAVSVAGSVVSLRGVTAGWTFVTVTASNAAGRVSQWFSVDVLAPPAPELQRVLSDQSTTVGAVVAFDVTPVFAGTVTSYRASSSDASILEASVDESIVVLRGVAAGSATATVVAGNGGSDTSVSFTVTVGAAANPVAAAPTVAGALGARHVAVGATLDVDVSGGFAGTVGEYIAVTGDAAVVAAAATRLGTIQLRGVAAGTATVRVVAVGAGAIVSQTLDVTVAEIAISATAPTHCLTGEGTPVTSSGGTVGRGGVASVDIAYTVTGGTGPYTITSPDTTGTTSADGSGTLTVSCARAGVDLTNVAPSVNAVESGPKTITVTATDTNGKIATTDVTFTVAEDAYTTANNGGTMAAGKTYVIGTSAEWSLVTLPAGLDLEFEGLSEIGENGAAHFSDTVSGSEIVLDWGTGEEIYRDVVTSAAARSGTTNRDVGALFDDLRDSATEPEDVADTRAPEGNSWRPYEGLPTKAFVAMHPNMLAGVPIRVCNTATRANFASDEAYSDFNRAFGEAIDAWNGKLHRDSATTSGTPHKIFESASNCSPSSFDVHVYRDPVGARCGEREYACAGTRKLGELAPMIGGGEPSHFFISIQLANEEFVYFRRALLHELGHFLGLGDYWRLDYNSADRAEGDCPTNEDKTVMAVAKLATVDDSDSGAQDETEPQAGYAEDSCGSAGLTKRDAADVHAIYHPDAFTNIRVEEAGTHPNVVYSLRGNFPRDTETNREFNAFRVVAWSRVAGTDDDWTFEGSARVFTDDWTLHAAVADGDFLINLGGTKPTAKEFLVAGVTRGDPERGVGATADTAPVKWEAHSEVTAAGDLGSAAWAEDVSWTLGDPAFGYGLPPPAPTGLMATVTETGADLAWDYVSTAREYEVLQSTGVVADATVVATVVQPALQGTITRSVALSGSGTYRFWVRAKAGVLVGPVSGSQEVTFGSPPTPTPTPTTTTTQPTPQPGPQLAAPTLSGATAVSHAEIEAVWTEVTEATGYEIGVAWTATPTAVTATSVGDVLEGAVGGLTPQRSYYVWVRAVDAESDGSRRVSSWSNQMSATTMSATIAVSGRVKVRRTAVTGDNDQLEFGYVDSKNSEILPANRFLRFGSLGKPWQRSSDVWGATSEGGSERLGRIVARRTAAGGDRIEVAFLPFGVPFDRMMEDGLAKPATRHKNYSDMVEDRWYISSVVNFTIPRPLVYPSASARSRVSADSESDMSPGSDGMQVCVGCEAPDAIALMDP